MRGLLLTSLFALSCAPVVRQDARVAIRRRALPTDQAVAIFHGAQVCSFTLRDASRGLHDLEQRRAGAVPVDMSRAVPDRPWWLQDSRYGATVVTVIAMPPGRYEVVGYAPKTSITPRFSRRSGRAAKATTSIRFAPDPR